MTGSVIVAIPSEDDPVWMVSSEKIPHLSLLFLGDQSKNPNLPDIVKYLGHVTNTSLHPFGLGVDHRGELGPDKADVLVFNSRDAKSLETIRYYLLNNPYIRDAYNSTEQFDSWIPHLTLGYPTNPAKDPKGYQPLKPVLSWVHFDRIALWEGNFEGPTFKLKSRDDGLDMAQMSDIGSEFLYHHGIKGMRWGVRRTRSQLDADSHEVSVKKATTEKIKKNRGSTDSLSNKELQDLVTRMNLEQQYTRLVNAQPTNMQKGQKFVRTVLTVGKTANEVASFINSPAGKILTSQLRK